MFAQLASVVFVVRKVEMVHVGLLNKLNDEVKKDGSRKIGILLDTEGEKFQTSRSIGSSTRRLHNNYVTHNKNALIEINSEKEGYALSSESMMKIRDTPTSRAVRFFQTFFFSVFFWLFENQEIRYRSPYARLARLHGLR